MQSRYLVLVFVCLLVISIPASSEMVVLKDYTIDTGGYPLYRPLEIDNNKVSCSWNGEETSIEITKFIPTVDYIDAINVTKPYPGYIVLSQKDPNIKIYVGIINEVEQEYLILHSNAKDEIVSFLLSQLKVYPKEESNSARLKAMQKRL
jgi:hypothetical protein